MGWTMSDLPEFARDAGESVKNRVRSALSWLPTPFTCNECGSPCEATEGFVERQAMVMEIYECPECGARFHRDDSSGVGGLSFDPYER